MVLPFPINEDSPVRSVAQDCDDPAALAELLGQLLGGDDVERGARADIQAVLVEQVVDHPDRLGVRDVQRAVDQVDVLLEIVGQPALADACGRASASGVLDSVQSVTHPQ